MGSNIANSLLVALKLERTEARPFVWSVVYFFCLLCAYYILRPVRDEMGIQGGVGSLQWVFSATFGVMLLAVPLFGWAVKRYPRGKLVSRVYLFFTGNLLFFFVLFLGRVAEVWVARIFFIWVSVFNLFVVSIFWSFMADTFNADQARRLFGSIAVGGSAGAILGPAITAGLGRVLGPVALLPVSIGFLIMATVCVNRLKRLKTTPDASGTIEQAGAKSGERAGREEAIGGGIFSAVIRVFRSPYLAGISLFILFYSTLSTFLYFEQAHIIENSFDSPDERTAVFAGMDLAVNILTVLAQMFLTSRLVERIGLAFTLMLVPVLVGLGFLLLGLFPVLSTLVVFQVIRRAGNFAIARPAREMLYTVLPAEDKYKSKNFIDTVVYRGGDAASGWAFAGLKGLGFSLSAISFIAIPIALVWALNGYLLGRRQRRIEQSASSGQDLTHA